MLQGFLLSSYLGPLTVALSLAFAQVTVPPVVLISFSRYSLTVLRIPLVSG
jgi:hypothetical protein